MKSKSLDVAVVPVIKVKGQGHNKTIYDQMSAFEGFFSRIPGKCWHILMTLITIHHCQISF